MTITIEELKQHLDEYVDRVCAGETVILTQGDRVIAELRPADDRSTARRPFGLDAGRFEVPPDFNDPLDDDLLDAFRG